MKKVCGSPCHSLKGLTLIRGKKNNTPTLCIFRSFILKTSFDVLSFIDYKCKQFMPGKIYFSIPVPTDILKKKKKKQVILDEYSKDSSLRISQQAPNGGISIANFQCTDNTKI